MATTKTLKGTSPFEFGTFFVSLQPEIITNLKPEIMQNTWLWYKPIGKIQISYGKRGEFYCSELLQKIKEREEGAYINDSGHNKFMCIGDLHRENVSKKTDTLKNGDVIEKFLVRIAKVTRERKDLVCKCGAPFILRGYPVHWQKVIKEGKSNGMFTVGGKTNDKIYYPRNKKAQTKLIDRLIKDAYDKVPA